MVNELIIYLDSTSNFLESKYFDELLLKNERSIKEKFADGKKCHYNLVLNGKNDCDFVTYYKPGKKELFVDLLDLPSDRKLEEVIGLMSMRDEYVGNQGKNIIITNIPKDIPNTESMHYHDLASFVQELHKKY